MEEFRIADCDFGIKHMWLRRHTHSRPTPAALIDYCSSQRSVIFCPARDRFSSHFSNSSSCRRFGGLDIYVFDQLLSRFVP